MMGVLAKDGCPSRGWGMGVLGAMMGVPVKEGVAGNGYERFSEPGRSVSVDLGMRL